MKVGRCVTGLVLAVVIVVVSGYARAGTAPAGYFLYGTGSSGKITVIDTATGAVAKTIDVGAPVGQLQVTPGGRVAYAVLGASPNDAKAGGASIGVIDLISNTLLRRIETGDAGPQRLAIHP